MPAVLGGLEAMVDGDTMVVGFGKSLLQALHVQLDKLRTFPALSAHGIDIPSTQNAMWCWLHGDERVELLYRTDALIEVLAPALSVVQVT